MKTDITFDRFIEVLVPGAILTIGVWYFHRSFLMVFFPAIASDTVIFDATGSTLGAKAAIFLIAAVCIGVLINYMADIAVVCVIRDASCSDKASRFSRRIIRWLAWPFVLIPAMDPRVHAIDRYLKSPRKGPFVRMMQRWAVTDESALIKPSEMVLAHQHIVARLKVADVEIGKVLAEIYRPVQVSSSVFIASA